MSPITIYGIKNCQTVQKALNFLLSKDVEVIFWDYKKQAIDKEHLQVWCDKFGWTKVLNRSGMMWRKADEQTKAKVTDQSTAIEFMLQIPTSIKRPIIEVDGDLILGFDEDEYNNFFG
jgi:arsenate reductase (glutaredoxin)